MKISQSGVLPLGSRAVYFENFGEMTGNYQSGVYKPNSHVEFKGNNGSSNFDLEASSIASSNFHSSQVADGSGRVVALLTAKGWYLLPDIKSSFETNEKIPDLTAFIRTGNPDTLTSYTDGTDLLYNSTDQFGKAVFLG